MLIIIKSNNLFFILTCCLSCTCKLDHTGKVTGLFEKEHENRYNWSGKESEKKMTKQCHLWHFFPILSQFYDTKHQGIGSIISLLRNFQSINYLNCILYFLRGIGVIRCTGFTLKTSSNPVPQRDPLMSLEVLKSFKLIWIALTPAFQPKWGVTTTGKSLDRFSYDRSIF